MAGNREEKQLICDNAELMAEWDWDKNNACELYPDKLSSGSNKKAYWKCSKSHEWREEIYKRSHGKRCPYCANKRVWIGYNDLNTLYPALAKEWNKDKNADIDINSVVPGSQKKVWWTCSVCGKEWKATVCYRTQNGTGCPECGLKKRGAARSKTLVKQNGCLTDEKLVKEWDYERNGDTRPENVTPFSNKSVSWRCSTCGHVWSAKICNRSNGRGCPCCSNQVVVAGKNDLATTHPALASEWHPSKNGSLTPRGVTYGCTKKVWWLCPKGHEYQATVSHRSNGTNCPKCYAGRQTSFAEQAFFYYIKKAFPDAVNRYRDIFDNGMELDIYIPSIHLAIEYDGIYWHKTEKSSREREKYEICRSNGIKLIRMKESDVTQPDTADEVFLMVNSENRKQLEQHIRYLLDKIDLRSNMWTRRKPVFHSPVDINIQRDELEIREYMTEIKGSLQELRPDIAEEWHPTKNGDLTPNRFSIGSDFNAWWKCKECGHEWQTTIGHRVSGTGCNECYRRRNREHHPLAKKILQYSRDGKLIREWNSISEASRELSINSSNISMCAKGQRSHAGGYVWKKGE